MTKCKKNNSFILVNNRFSITLSRRNSLKKKKKKRMFPWSFERVNDTDSLTLRLLFLKTAVFTLVYIYVIRKSGVPALPKNSANQSGIETSGLGQKMTKSAVGTSAKDITFITICWELLGTAISVVSTPTELAKSCRFSTDFFHHPLKNPWGLSYHDLRIIFYKICYKNISKWSPKRYMEYVIFEYDLMRIFLGISLALQDK